MKVFNKTRALRKLKFKQNKGKYIKYGTIGISCLILVLGVMYFTFAKFESQSPEWTLIHGKVKYDGGEDANIVAIYKDGGKVDEIPSENSGYMFDKAECTNGATAKWDYDEWALTLKSTTKTKCSIYFVEENAAQKIRALVTGTSSSSTEVIDKGTDSSGCTNTLVYDGTSDKNLRYVGSNPCNYVTYNKETAGWRIIGVFNNVKTNSSGTTTETLAKIIRKNSLGAYSWNTSINPKGNNGSGINQWGASTYSDGTTYEGAALMRELNTDYLGNVTVGTNGYWYNSSNNEKEASKPKKTLNTNAQNMIQDVLWNTGSNGSNTSSTWSPQNMYTYERSSNTGKICSSGDWCNDTVIRTSTWYGKVALMYPSDYGYATSGGTTTNRTTCLTTSMYSWDDSGVANCKDNDWLYNSSKTQWTLSPYASSADARGAFFISSRGFVTSLNGSYSDHAVRPVIFLKSTVKITGGTGTATDPYTLG